VCAVCVLFVLVVVRGITLLWIWPEKRTGFGYFILCVLGCLGSSKGEGKGSVSTPGETGMSSQNFTILCSVQKLCRVGTKSGFGV
jgi:hypothetical protein